MYMVLLMLGRQKCIQVSHLYLSLVVSRLEKLKRYKPPGTDQIPVEQIQAGDNVLRSEIHKLINSIWNKEQLPWQCNEFIIVPICNKVIKLTRVISL